MQVFSFTILALDDQPNSIFSINSDAEINAEMQWLKFRNG